MRSKPNEIEWHGLVTSRSMPSVRRSPTFRPLASTTSRAEIMSPLASVGVCRSAPVLTSTTLSQANSAARVISARIAAISASYMVPNCWFEVLSSNSRIARSVLTAPSDRTQHGFGEPSRRESPQLLNSAELFDAGIDRIGLMRVDQDVRDPGARAWLLRSTPRGPADDYNVGMPHEGPDHWNRVLRREWQIKPYFCEGTARRCSGALLPIPLYPGKM